MPQGEWFMLMGMGGLFVFLGLVTIFWGKHEEKSYYNSLSTRPDVREYLERSPKYPQHEALKIGGWIAITIGLLTMLVGGAFWLWG